MKPVDIGDFGCGALPAMGRCEAVLPDTPDCAPNYHFGMLLGVADFRAEQGFHIGRLRRHQRLLHGSGVAAGYDVTFKDENFELRVGPGYAIDPLGRDLVLDVAQCVSLPRWWLVHREDDAFDDVPNKDNATVNLDVIACYACCLGSPVPAIAEPCAGDAADIAYSRVCEIVKLKLVRTPDPLPAAPPPIEGATLEHEALAQAVAKKLRQLPEGDSEDEKFCLTLARLHDVHLELQPGSAGWTASVGSIELGVRDSLLPTSMLQALLLGDPAPAPSGPVVAGEPVVAGTQLNLVFSQKLAPSSVTAAAFAVSEFTEAQGWKPFTIGTATYDESDPAKPTVRLTLDRAPDAAFKLIRITVIGSGNAPLLGANLIPAGAVRPSDEGRTLTTSIHGS